jgi:hypothetical protein
MARFTVAPLLVGLLVFSSCSRTKTLEDARSDVTSAVSLAAESETFIDYIRQGRATGNFTAGHIQYLIEEIQRSTQELAEPVPDERVRRKLEEVSSELRALVTELQTVSHEIGNAQALTAIRERVTAIRHRLEAANSSL